MADTDSGFSTRRLLLILGIGVLLVLAWVGGRMSAGGTAPFGVMGNSMHGSMMGRGSMQSGEHMMSESEAEVGGTFDGERGLRRCRAMMGTMAGMHRSMQSLMGGNRGAMDGRGDMPERRRSMQEQMGAMMEEMGPDEMWDLCQTMHASMRAAMHGQDVALAGDVDETAFQGMSLADETEQWLRGAQGFDAVEDRTGQDEVVVEVGAGDGLRYAPAAIRVDPGTTVRWRWTGRGGLHDVAFTSAEISTTLKGEEGATLEYTFDAAGEYRYECTPHAGVGMRGAIFVAEEESNRA